MWALEVDEEFVKGLEKALETERLAVFLYLRALDDISELGLKSPLLAKVFGEIVLDSILHKNIVKAIIESIEEARAVKEVIERHSDTQSQELRPEHIGFIERLLEEHDRLEEGVENLYRELAEKAPSKLVAKILAAIAEDEEKHEDYLVRIRKALIHSSEVRGEED